MDRAGCSTLKPVGGAGAKEMIRVRNDRAASLATAVVQIIATAPEDELQAALEEYLRDELAAIARQIASERQETTHDQ